MPEFSRRPLAGLFPLLPLSLDADGEIDEPSIRHNIGILGASGVPGMIVFGSMGQMTNVSEAEFDRVTEIAVEEGHRHDLAVVIGSTAPYQGEAIRRLRVAERAGADGSMLAAPYVLPLTDDQALGFFRDAAQSLDGDLALMLYNYSPLNGLNITPDMWARLLDEPNIKAIKESNFSLPHFDQILLTIADRVNVFTGNDPAFFHGSVMGAVGATGIFCWAGLATANRFVEECSKGNHGDPWVRTAFEALQRVSASIRTPDMPRMLTYEHGYLNAIVEINGGRAGAPRKPYGVLPGHAVERMRSAMATLQAMESEGR
jgi:dihydrodipicolinate synthase/N-acetylneuraminate lyase